MTAVNPRVKRLPPRLEAAASLYPAGARLCDVGSDHARLPVALLRRGLTPFALLTDIHPGPLERARSAVAKAGWQRQAGFMLTDGLDGVDPDAVDCVTMTGLGGETMAAILAKAPWTQNKTLILQPMQGFAELRSFLCAAGYAVTDETIAREGERLYPVMAVAGGAMRLTPGELVAGPERLLKGNPHWPSVLARHIRRIETALAAASASSKPGDDARAGYMINEITDLRRLWHENQRQRL